MGEEKTKPIDFIVRIGPLLKEVLDKQKQNIKKETYDVCKSSEWEAGEIVAKKIIENKLV